MVFPDHSHFLIWRLKSFFASPFILERKNALGTRLSYNKLLNIFALSEGNNSLYIIVLYNSYKMFTLDIDLECMKNGRPKDTELKTIGLVKKKSGTTRNEKVILSHFPGMICFSLLSSLFSVIVKQLIDKQFNWIGETLLKFYVFFWHHRPYWDPSHLLI